MDLTPSKYRCDICNIDKYYTYSELIEHKKICINLCKNKDDKLVIYQCNQCEKNYRQRYLLNRHIFYEHIKGGFKCSMCDHSFKYYRSLKNHIRDAHDDMKYKCPICGILIKRREDINKHIIYAHNARYICPICNTLIKHQSNIARHIKHMHYNRQRSDVFRHSKHMHNNTQIFYCDKCEKSYLHERNLNRHKRDNHKMIF